MSEQETNYAIKITDESDDTFTIGGYGVVFGGVDIQGETFTDETDYWLDRVPVKAVFYDHSQGQKMPAVVGETVKEEQDEIGIWVETQLQRASSYAQAVRELIKKGVPLGYSSGAVSHLSRVEEGTIKSWPIFEYSITPTPAEPRTVGIERVKQLADTYTDLKTLLESDQEIANADVTDGGGDATIIKETKKMTEEVKEVQKEQPEQPALTLDQVTDAMKAAVAPISDRLEALEQQETNVPEVAAKQVNVVTDTDHWKYDNVDSGDLAVMVGVLEEAKRNGRSRGGASVGAYKALAHRLESEEADKREPMQVARGAFKSLGVKANEINQSTLANYGDEWVGVAYSGQLWESIRHATFVLGKLPSMEVPAGAESVVIPLESTDPTWYKVNQAANLSANPGGVPTNTVTASNLGTANTTLTLGKMGARVLWTGEMEEDSVLPYVAQLQQQLAVSGAEYLEHVLIDGDTDTSATTNINDIGGTPGGTEAFLILNGFRKSPIITTSANSRDGGALTVDDYLETVKLMGNAGKNALDRMKVSFIIDPSTHWKTLGLDEVKTQDVFSAPTIENGQLTRIWGYEVINSAHMAKGSGSGLTNSAGKVDLDTTSNNTLGQILAVRWDQWQFGWRRRMTIETTRVPAADSTEIVALMRFGMIQRDTEASAISYNLTV